MNHPPHYYNRLNDLKHYLHNLLQCHHPSQSYPLHQVLDHHLTCQRQQTVINLTARLDFLEKALKQHQYCNIAIQGLQQQLSLKREQILHLQSRQKLKIEREIINCKQSFERQKKLLESKVQNYRKEGQDRLDELCLLNRELQQIKGYNLKMRQRQNKMTLQIQIKQDEIMNLKRCIDKNKLQNDSQRIKAQQQLKRQKKQSKKKEQKQKLIQQINKGMNKTIKNMQKHLFGLPYYTNYDRYNILYQEITKLKSLFITIRQQIITQLKQCFNVVMKINQFTKQENKFSLSNLKQQINQLNACHRQSQTLLNQTLKNHKTIIQSNLI